MAAGYKVGCGGCLNMGPSHSGEHDLYQDTVGGLGSYGNLAPTPSGGMPRTIEEMFASGKLTKAQLEAASMPNVMTLFDAPANDKAELAHFMQRFILDGYMRGVDVVKLLKEKPTKYHLDIIDIQSAYGRPSGAVATANQSRAGFDTSYWDDSTSYISKLTTFYHEMGHGLLDQNHNENEGGSWIMSHNGPGSTFMSNYDERMGELFNPSNPGKVQAPGGATGTPTGAPVSGPSTPSVPEISQLTTTPTIKLNIGGGVTIGGGEGVTASFKPNIGGYSDQGGSSILGSKTGPAYAAFGPVPDQTIKVGENNIFQKTLKDVGAKGIKVG